MFAGSNIDGNLTRLDPQTGDTITYSAANSAKFGGLLLGDGYRITSSLSTPVTISYQGVADGVPDAHGRMTDMWIALPGNKKNGLGSGGVHWVGTPFNHAVCVDKCFISDGRYLWTVSQAVEEGLVDGLWDSMDNETKQPLKVGLRSLNPDQYVLQPGMMYQITTHRNDLALIVPADVPEPPCLAGLVCGIGCLAAVRRRRSR